MRGVELVRSDGKEIDAQPLSLCQLSRAIQRSGSVDRVEIICGAGSCARFKAVVMRWSGHRALRAARTLCSADHHLADLNHRGLVGVVRYVGHDLFRMRPETRLKTLHGIAEDMAHAHVSCRGAGRATGEALVNGVVLAA